MNVIHNSDAVIPSIPSVPIIFAKVFQALEESSVRTIKTAKKTLVVMTIVNAPRVSASMEAVILVSSMMNVTMDTFVLTTSVFHHSPPHVEPSF